MGSLICLTNKRNKKQNGKTLNVANVASRPRSHPKTIYVVLYTILERWKQLRCLIISSLQKIKEKEIWTLQTTKQNNKITKCKHIPFLSRFAMRMLVGQRVSAFHRHVIHQHL